MLHKAVGNFLRCSWGRAVIYAVCGLAPALGPVWGQVVLEDFTTVRTSRTGDDLWTLTADNPAASYATANGLWTVTGSTTTAEKFNIVSISKGNPGIVTTDRPASWSYYTSAPLINAAVGEQVTFSGITGSGCLSLNTGNSYWQVMPVDPQDKTRWYLYQGGMGAGVDTSSCTYTGGGVGQACAWSATDSCGFYWQFRPIGPGGYSYPRDYAQGYVKSGTWDPGMNRLRYQMMCTRPGASGVIVPASNGASNHNNGTYTKAISNAALGSQGQHYYHDLNPNIYQGQWMTYELNRMVSHRVGASDGYVNWPEDPEWYLPSRGTQAPVHYFDGLTRFYMQIGPVNGVNDAWSNLTCRLGTVVMDKVANQPEAYTRSTVSQYNGSAYEVWWGGPRNGTSASTTFRVHYSANDMMVNGFSSGTDGGSVQSEGGAYAQARWTSPAMQQAATMYVGIRPVMNINAATNTAPILVSLEADHNMPTGSHVTIAGVAGNTAANGNWTVTSIPPIALQMEKDTLGGGEIAQVTGGPGLVTVTTTVAHGLTVGRTFQLMYDASGALYNVTYMVASAPDANHFTFVAPQNTPSFTLADPTKSFAIYAPSALALNGSTGNGTFVARTGTLVSTDDTANFRQIRIDRMSSNIGLSCDLNGDGVVDSKDEELQRKMALHLLPCTNDLNGDGACSVAEVQRIDIAASGGLCRIGK